MPVLNRAVANLGARNEPSPQYGDQLIQEDGHPVIDLRFRGRRNRRRGDRCTATPAGLWAVEGNEFVEHYCARWAGSYGRASGGDYSIQHRIYFRFSTISRPAAFI